MLNKAFTLVEIVIVILILGIVAAAVTPKILSLREDARYSAEECVIGALKEAVQRYIVLHEGKVYQGDPFDLLAVRPEGWTTFGMGGPDVVAIISPSGRLFLYDLYTGVIDEMIPPL